MGAWAPSALDEGAFDLVDGEVRELVRRRSLDPSTQADAVRAAVDEVLDAYETRSLVGDVPVADRRALARRVIDAVAGFGPLQPYLDDDRSRRSGSTTRAGCSSPATAAAS